MGKESLLGKFLELSAGASVVGIGMNTYAAAWSEEARDFDVLRIHKADKVLHDDVHAVLVKVAVIAKTEEIEFETFALHHTFIGDVGYAHFGKVGLAGNGAEGRELGTVEAYPIVVVGMFIIECFEHLWGIIAAVFCFTSEGIEVEVVSGHGFLTF